MSIREELNDKYYSQKIKMIFTLACRTNIWYTKTVLITLPFINMTI